VLVGIFSSVNVVAQVSVGVQEGDLIEYTVSYTGSPSENYPNWVKIDVTNIQGTSITADLTVERRDGTSDTNSGTFDLDTGVPDLLLIPAGLIVGDEFYHEELGNITIAGSEEDTYAGATRIVVYAHVKQISLHWDQATGILLQSNQYTVTFTQIFQVDKTNVWQSQILGVDSTVFYVVIVTILAVIAIIVVYLLRRR
jgi:hypothetical protein